MVTWPPHPSHFTATAVFAFLKHTHYNPQDFYKHLPQAQQAYRRWSRRRRPSWKVIAVSTACVDPIPTTLICACFSDSEEAKLSRSELFARLQVEKCKVAELRGEIDAMRRQLSLVSECAAAAVDKALKDFESGVKGMKAMVYDIHRRLAVRVGRA